MSEARLRDKGDGFFRQHSWRVKIAVIVLLLPLLFFGLSNLWLVSSWGTNATEVKLKEKTGMDWEVHSVTWSPWNGATINNAMMLQPEILRDDLEMPLVEVKRINVKPYWGQLIRGKIRFREISMESPNITLPIEMLALLANNHIETVTPSEPNQGNIKPPVVKHNPRPPKLSGDQKPSVKKPTQQKKAKVVKSKPKPERPSAGLPMRIRIDNASIKVLSSSKRVDLLDISDIDLDLPVFGEDTEGSIKLGLLKVQGLKSIHNMEQKIQWRRPYLEIEQKNLSAGGVNIKYGVKLGLLRGLPFLMDFIMEPQPIEHVGLLDRLALDVKVDRASGRLNAGGSLVKPMSWRGSMVMLSDSFSVREKHGGHQLFFDELSIPAVFQRGQLSWLSARIIGEDISFLGNGQVAITDGVTSVTRVVASPEIAVELREAMIGTRLINRRSWWQDLQTPDRKYRDIHVTGSLAEANIDLGSQHQNLALWQTLTAVLNFIRVEMEEEGVTLKSIPNEEFFKN